VLEEELEPYTNSGSLEFMAAIKIFPLTSEARDILRATLRTNNLILTHTHVRKLNSGK